MRRLLGAIILVVASPAWAFGAISLSTTPTLDLLSGSTATTAAFVVRANFTSLEQVIACDVKMTITPRAGATGGVTIVDVSSVTEPTSNYLFTQDRDGLYPTLSDPDPVNGGYRTFHVQDALELNLIENVPLGTRDLAVVQLRIAPNTSGLFDLRFDPVITTMTGPAPTFLVKEPTLSDAVITVAVPEPAALWLLSAGVATMILLRRPRAGRARQARLFR